MDFSRLMRRAPEPPRPDFRLMVILGILVVSLVYIIYTVYFKSTITIKEPFMSSPFGHKPLEFSYDTYDSVRERVVKNKRVELNVPTGLDTLYGGIGEVFLTGGGNVILKFLCHLPMTQGDYKVVLGREPNQIVVGKMVKDPISRMFMLHIETNEKQIFDTKLVTVFLDSNATSKDKFSVPVLIGEW